MSTQKLCYQCNSNLLLMIKELNKDIYIDDRSCIIK